MATTTLTSCGRPSTSRLLSIGQVCHERMAPAAASRFPLLYVRPTRAQRRAPLELTLAGAGFAPFTPFGAAAASPVDPEKPKPPLSPRWPCLGQAHPACLAAFTYPII